MTSKIGYVAGISEFHARASLRSEGTGRCHRRWPLVSIGVASCARRERVIDLGSWRFAIACGPKSSSDLTASPELGYRKIIASCRRNFSTWPASRSVSFVSR